MSQTNRLISVVASITLSIACRSDALAQSQSNATRIDLSYTETMDRIYPNPRNGIVLVKTLTLTLSARNSISVATSAASVGHRSGKLKPRDSSVGEGALGQRWKVSASSVLTRTDQYPTHTKTLRVIVTGSSCTFTVTYARKPGASYYELPMLPMASRKAGRYVNLATTSTSCHIE